MTDVEFDEQRLASQDASQGVASRQLFRSALWAGIAVLLLLSILFGMQFVAG